MTKNLLIVESPAKAKTIEKFLGKDFTVKSSFGHVRDLKKGDKGVLIDKGFLPQYEVSPDKAKVVQELTTWVKKTDDVWLATDEDREGEAISWHLCEVLNLDPTKAKRIVFREITKPAIQKAISNPRKLDLNLVNAQQARRVLDRLVGFELSELLWRKVKNKLSAGRVQSVAVKLVVEKEREINQHKVESNYKVKAYFPVPNRTGKLVDLEANLPDAFKKEAEAASFLKQLIGAEYHIQDIQVKPSYKKPAPPFTTSTLQQEASRKLGFSVNRTMSAAQKLYEAGHITYMRTDSTALSDEALTKMAAEITSSFGPQYLKTRQYKSKQALAQEAHEAIRPTYMEVQHAGGDRDQKRLYELIWKRSMASQMADAILEKTQVDISISSLRDRHFEAEGEVLKFDGFLKLYMESSDDDENGEHKGMLPPLTPGQKLQPREIKATERFSRPPSRYTEAGLVKRLEELGIGRPSTYAPIISKIMEKERGYVIKDSRPGLERSYRELTLHGDKIHEANLSEMTGATMDRLYPSDIGMVVSDFLSQNFDRIMDYSFTAEIEKEFDQIAADEIDWKKMLSDFYFPFHDLVEDTLKISGKATGERVLGKDPKTGKTIIARMSRFGPVVQLGNKEEGDEKPEFASIRNNQSIETITLDEALELFKLPKILGSHEGAEVSVGLGRYGCYVKHGDQFITLPRNEDVLKVELDRAIELIQQKKVEDAPVGYFQGKPITKGKGRFGPFVKWDDLYVNVPKKYILDTITESEAIELIEAKQKKEDNRYILQWPEEKISVENGRWGPFIRSGKKFITIPKMDGKKVDAEAAKAMTLEQVKEIITKAG